MKNLLTKLINYFRRTKELKSILNFITVIKEDHKRGVNISRDLNELEYMVSYSIDKKLRKQ